MKFERFQQLVRMMFLSDEAGNIRTRYENVDAANIHPLVLAYIGDAYFHLYVRMRLLSYEQTQVQALHAFSAQIVSALWQARAYRGISEMLTEEEQTIYRRARNTKSHAPRSASVAPAAPRLSSPNKTARCATGRKNGQTCGTPASSCRHIPARSTVHSAAGNGA